MILQTLSVIHNILAKLSMIQNKRNGVDIVNKSDIIGQNNKLDFLERIARMYYLFDMTQSEVATQMGIGRSSVARFLKEAKEENVVRFLISSNTGNARRVDLENKLVNKYKLIDAIVVKEDVNSLYESTVVNYLNTTIPLKGNLGLGGGTTLQGIGKFLNVCDARPELKIVQMIGGFSNNELEMPSTTVIQQWSQSLKSNPYFLPASAIVETKEMKEAFLKNKYIKDIYNEIRNIDVSVVGIGNIDTNSVILNHELVEGLTIDELKKESVGDINFHYFDLDGNFTLPHISEKVIGASPLDLLRVPVRIGLAYGKDKKQAIEGAVKGRLVNVLATTEETANMLLNSIGEEEE